MRDADKNRDPDKARKRAAADLKCALRKLGMLDIVEGWHGEPMQASIILRGIMLAAKIPVSLKHGGGTRTGVAS